MQLRSLIFAAAISFAPFASAQNCLTTLFAGGNSGGNINNTVYFTATVAPANGVTFTSFDLNLDSATVGATVGCEVYARFGSGHAGNEDQPGWIYLTSGTGTMAGIGLATTMTFNSPCWLPNGVNALAIRATGGAKHVYTNGNGSNQNYSNADLTLDLGSATNSLFTLPLFNPRIANVTLCYNVGGGTAYPDFDVSTPVGPGPLTVNFIDKTYTTDPAGIAIWQWDFDNDGTFDVSGNTPAEQNPQWVFAVPGAYDVRLEVLDNFGTATRVRTGVVTVGAPTSNTESADLLHYLFNEPPRPGQLGVYNAASTDLAPRFGEASNDLWQGDPNRPLFQTGEAGFGCLGEAGVGGSNAVDTGLALSVTNMTIAWWHRTGNNGASVSNGFAYVFGGPGSTQRCFIDGNAGTGLLRYSGTGVGDVNSFTDIRTGQAGVWTHVALVIDNDNGNASWYINGALDVTQPFTPGDHVVERDEFWVGFHNGTQNYSLFYSMDDFRMYSRALDATEVATIATGREPAATTVYGVGCAGPGGLVPQTSASGGAPVVGNPLYAIEVDDAEPSSFAGFAFGRFCNQATAVGGTLPAPLAPLGLGFGAGCELEIGDLITVALTFQATGSTTVQLPIPNNPALNGGHIFAQGLVIGSQFVVGDAIDIGLKL